ncbi:MAG: hypothetical protein K8R58_06910 [Bacteroidales bacterium]|nr:hypothetical protein [Bacteroidales bacterium]
MKKLIFLLLIIPFVFSCNTKKINELQTSNDSLVMQANLRDESINEFVESFNEIQDNLDSIKKKELIITKDISGKIELKKADKDRIIRDIKSIYQMLLENKERVASLKKKLGGSNYKIAQLNKMIEHLNKQIEEKDTDISQMKTDLEKLNIKIVTLKKDVNELSEENKIKAQKIEEQEEVIDLKIKELNTAYFAIGTKKVLKENNIITKEGGFIGIGASKKLKEDFDKGFFKKIDITKTKKIPISGKKAKIITNHPTGSYEFSGENNTGNLIIKNPNKFWGSSKYLVIIVN